MNPETQKLIWWVFALPIFGFLVQSLTGKLFLEGLGKRFGKVLMGTLAVAPVALSFLIAVGITASLHSLPEGQRSAVVTLFEWIKIGGLNIPFEFRIDTLSMTMVLIITGIGSLIHIFATSYMAEDPDYTRFFTYLNLFVAAMLTLVLGNNLVLLFVGWEGVGVCSYLLIGFWYKDTKNSFAANKAFIANRVGDVGLTLGIFLLAAAVLKVGAPGEDRLLSYDVILTVLPAAKASLDPNLMFWAVTCLFIGAMGKSAQFPLYVWLPDAMAGPTPVSALIHAATMVTSGVFLLNRMSPVVQLAPAAMTIITVVGVITAALGAAIAFGQSDIKKVLAFSTVSQLGYMFIACGVGAFWVGLFHVITHAFFKALLFLGSGAVIHAMAHDQEMPHYGNLRKYLPITSAVMIVGWLSISGFPFLAGFYSKEAILHAAKFSEAIPSWASQLGLWGALAVALLTAAYMTRMTMMTFFSGEERWRLIPAHGHDDHGHAAHHGHDDHADHGDHGHADPNHFFMTDAEFAEAEAKEEHEHHHALDASHEPKEVPALMWVPLAILALLSIIGGAWLKNGVGLEHWLGSSVVLMEHGGAEAGGGFFADLTEALGNPLFYMSFIVFAAGCGYGYWKYAKSLPENDGMDTGKWAAWRKAAGKQFGIDGLFTQGLIKVGYWIGVFCKNVIDWLIELIVNGVPRLIESIGTLLRGAQSGYVRSYAAIMQIGIAVVIGYVMLLMATGGGR